MSLSMANQFNHLYLTFNLSISLQEFLLLALYLTAVHLASLALHNQSK